MLSMNVSCLESGTLHVCEIAHMKDLFAAYGYLLVHKLYGVF